MNSRDRLRTSGARRFCVAPMLDWTDRHARYFMRLVTGRAMLYTEMVTTGALLHGDRDRFLAHHADEGPVALQLGGSDPGELAECAGLGREAGFDEINLNVGCPSDRVRAGRFGACLMAEPELVADCVRAMLEAVPGAVTVKSRIGIDRSDTFDHLERFVEAVAGGGCRTFIVHARKAWLDGLSPRQNREIPPLRHDVVARLKECRPELEIIVNGGILDLDQAEHHLRIVDGVMVGRAACRDPWLLADVDRRIFGVPGAAPSRAAVMARYLDYIEHGSARGVWLKHMIRPILGLYLGRPGARAWRRALSEGAAVPEAGADLVRRALERVEVEQGRNASRPPPRSRGEPVAMFS
jgi:tRNA-dihydrouridine synthase A